MCLSASRTPTSPRSPSGKPSSRTSPAAFSGGLRTSSTLRLPTPCRREPAFYWIAEPDALRSAGPHVLQYTSAPCALRVRTRVLAGCGTSSAAFPGGLRAVRTFGVRPVRCASRRLAGENLHFSGMRNLLRHQFCPPSLPCQRPVELCPAGRWRFGGTIAEFAILL